MFIHHFFTFPHYWLPGLYYSFWDKWSSILCKPFQICVPIFCFITGYFFCKNNTINIKYCCKKSLQLLIPYWMITTIFIIISILYGNMYSLLDILLELFALKRPTMVFCWYVYFYLVSLLFLLIFSKLVFKNRYIKYVISGLLFSLFFVVINNQFPVFDTIIAWFPIMLSGYFCAEFDLLRLFARIKNFYGFIICLLLFIISSFMRWYLPDISIMFMESKIIYITLDIVYAPIAVGALATIFFYLDKLRISYNLLTRIGEKSMYMWFIHCIFFNNCKSIFQPILYWPRNSVLVLMWGMFVCYVFACLLSKLYSPIEQRIVNNIYDRKEG